MKRNLLWLIVVLEAFLFVFSCSLSSEQQKSATFVLAGEMFAKSQKHLQQKNFKEASIILVALLSHHPDNIVILNNLAVSLFELGRTDQAIDLLARVFQSDDTMAVSYRNLSKLYAYQALLDYQTALAIKSIESPKPLLQAVVVYTESTRMLIRPQKIPQDEEIFDSEKTVSSLVLAPENEDPLVMEARPAEILVKEDMERFVRSWASAWSEQETDLYFAKYTENYRPRSGASNQEWKDQRVRKILIPKNIMVDISDMTVSRTATGMYEVMFIQTYTSDIFQSVTKKQLKLEEKDGVFSIVRERVLQRVH